MFSIIIVTYNSEKHIFNCLDSIKKSGGDYEVIIVDNSGKDYGIEGVLVNESGSYPSGLNRGITCASKEYLVCCNPDIIVEPGWLEKMKWLLDNGYGMVGPMSNYASGVQGLPGPWFPQINALDVSFIIGFCFMLKASTWAEIGHFDEQFEFEQDDLDYSIRCRQAGFPIGVMPHCHVQHVGHQSAATEASKSTEKRWDSFFKLLKKYPDLDFEKYMGCGWHPSWLVEVQKRYPEVNNLRSFQSALASVQGR